MDILLILQKDLLDNYKKQDLEILARFYGISVSRNLQELAMEIARRNLDMSLHRAEMEGNLENLQKITKTKRVVSSFKPLMVKLTAKVNDEDDTLTDNYVYQAIIDADPSPKKQYTSWIIRGYIDGGIEHFEDISARVPTALRRFEVLSKQGHLSKEEKKIDNYCGLTGCTKKGKEKPGLEDLIERYTTTVFNENETDEIKAGTEYIFENDNVRVLSPKTEESSCFYGQGTTWCTAGDDGNRFEDYNEDGPLYILIPKIPKNKGEKYQIHFATTQYMNKKNNRVNRKFLIDRFPEAIRILVKNTDNANEGLIWGATGGFKDLVRIFS